MGTAKALVNFEDVSVWITATPELNHYDVPGSPVWIEYVNPEIDSLEIMGIDVDPLKIPKDLYEVILSEAMDTVEDDTWES